MSADVHLLAGAYALDALPQDERLFFERHLAACDACRDEVADFAATAAVLAEPVAEPPPAGLRDRVLAAADATRQLPPLSPPAAAPTGFSGRLRPLLAAAAVVSTLAAVGLGATVLRLDARVEGLEQMVAQAADGAVVAQVLNADDVTELALAGAPGASARFVYSPERDAGVLAVEGLPALPEHQVYELWLFHDGRPVPGGTFATTADGVTTAVVEGSVEGAQMVAVTVEPFPGRAEPSGEIVVSGTV